ncbi:MAG: endopeptidase La [Chloroflexota bacterium]|nr:endopeptidase La [Chloroflexota bacterium]
MIPTNEKFEEKPIEVSIPGELSILPSGEYVIFPSVIIPLAASDERTIKLIDEAVAGDKIIGIFAIQHRSEKVSPEDLYKIGTAANIVKMLKMPDGSVRALLQGLKRIKLVEISQTDPFFKGTVEVATEEKKDMSPELEALMRNISSLFQKMVSLSPNLPDELSVAAMNLNEPGMVADFVAAHSNLKLEESQELLETLDVQKRLERLTTFVNNELEILELRSKIQYQVQEEMDKSQREFVLREQLKAIQKELGEVDERTMEINELRGKIEEAQLPAEALKEAERELDRLSKMPPQAAEYTTARTYLDWVISLPWNTSTEDNLDVVQAQRVLDEDHYDLEKVKERILDYLAVRTLKENMRQPILCFAGPPGTGKTSVGKSIARALGRNFIRMSLGGIRDEAEIRGHRRTYIGALPGRIIQSIRRAGSNNPIFMLDEIDKVGADFRGDPSAALLEALDPEQNFAFSDHYLEVPFDLSKVMFITTANLIDPIPPALRDRMEILELPGYTEVEKLHIAKKFLVPKQLEEHGLKKQDLRISDDAILTIVRNYTREAGLRNLEREIGTICRKTAREVAQGSKKRTNVSPRKVQNILGVRKFRHEVAERSDEIGVATGLAWTPAGGDVLFIESTLMPGKGNLILTGQLGDVMQESARAALSYARANSGSLGVKGDFFSKNDIHVHVPAGAIPKDGPSAGITMAVSLISTLTKRPVSKDVGMTGEITLRGKVLPIGGIKEKVLAANRAGIKTVLLPKDNEKDLAEVPKHIKGDLRFIFVEHVDEVLKETLMG